MTNNFHSEDDQWVERLIRSADDGPDIPAGGAEALKQAIRPLWREEVRRRGRNQRVMWATGLALAATVLVVIGLRGSLSDRLLKLNGPIATVSRVTGTVASAGQAATIVAGAQIFADTDLQTGDGSRVALDLKGGQSLRLDASTSIRFVSADSLILEHGGVYVDSGEGGHDGVEIHSSFGIATDVGTQFEVRQSKDSMVVRVRQGRVLLDRGSETHEISPGFQVTVGKDGSVVRREVSSNAQDWVWAQEIAPSFVIEGRSVMTFLDWINRETGSVIRFADRETEILAEQTTLHGSLEGMTPLQAPDFVLPSCGLGSRLEGDVLIVERSLQR